MSVVRNIPAWRQRALRRIADMERRIATLAESHVPYCGAGFSWEWPGSLAATKRQIEGLPDRPRGREQVVFAIVASVRLENTVEQIRLAELCAAGDCRHAWRRRWRTARARRRERRRLRRLTSASRKARKVTS